MPLCLGTGYDRCGIRILVEDACPLDRVILRPCRGCFCWMRLLLCTKETAFAGLAPGLYRLLKAVERSARLVQEDLHRESGYMLPQSKKAHDLLKQLLENPPTPEFPREAAQALLEKLPQNEA